MAKKFLDKVKEKEYITIDFIGDSITHGRMYCRNEETYVAKFANFLSREFPECRVCRYDGVPAGTSADPMKSFDGPVLCSIGNGGGSIDVIRNGIGGSTVWRATLRPQDYMGELANGRRHDIVFLMFGINDALTYAEDKYAPPEKFKENYRKLINMVRDENPDVSFVITLATTNNYTIDEHVKKTIELAEEEHIPYIDTYKLWCDHYKEGVDHFGHGDWLHSDGDACHPMPIASEIMGRFVFEKFMELVRNGLV